MQPVGGEDNEQVGGLKEVTGLDKVLTDGVEVKISFLLQGPR